MQREQLTIQFFHTALEDLFLSIPESIGSRYEDLLAEVVNQAEMSNMMEAFGLIEPVELISTVQNIRGEDSYFGPTLIDRRAVDRPNYPARATLAQMAFDEQFIAFSTYVEKIIMVSLKRLGKRFNPYQTVTIIPHTGPRGGIISLELVLGEDIRHVYFRTKFPRGRFSTSDQSQVRDEPGVPEDS